MASVTATSPAMIGWPASSAALTRSMRAMARPVRAGGRAKRADRPPVDCQLRAGRGQGTFSLDDQHPPPGRAAMLHARDDLLADIAALLEADAAGLVEQHVMREGVAELVVGPAFGNAVGDAQGLPGGWDRRRSAVPP